MTKASQRDPMNPWFTDEIKTLQEETHAAYDAWKTGGCTPALWAVHIDTRKCNRRRKCRKQRKLYWQKVKMAKETPEEMSELLKLIQYKDKTKINCFKKSNGEITLPGAETGEN